MTLPPWSLHSVENTAMMGLQATTATKRKYEMGACGNAGEVQANCSPAKASRWSTTIAPIMAETIAVIAAVVADTTSDSTTTDEEASTATSDSTTTTPNSVPAETYTTTTPSTHDSSPESHPIVVVATSESLSPPSRPTALSTVTNSDCVIADTVAPTENIETATSSPAQSSAPSAPVPIPPPNSIAKLEPVAEPWNAEPIVVDSISRLQAVAVPDTWGSSSDLSGTRSALATTLMHADDMDEDDEDFEDDFDEEEESIIPSYAPMRYPCAPPSANRSTGNSNYNMTASSTSSSNGYGKPNFYSEPYPQQNCSRTPTQYARQTNQANNNNSAHYGWTTTNGGYYMPPEGAQPHPQQTIRCAENGKSYLELGNSTYTVPLPPQQAPPPQQQHQPPQSAVDPRSIHPAAPPKRCSCDGRNSWCANRNCYRERRLKMRNLSMFKLSRFRQVSEQSLYRSVLICNTLKSIDREMELEARHTPPEPMASQHNNNNNHHNQHQQHHHHHHPHQHHHHHHQPLHHHHHHMHHHHYNNHPRVTADQQQQQHLQCPTPPPPSQPQAVVVNGGQYGSPAAAVATPASASSPMDADNDGANYTTLHQLQPAQQLQLHQQNQHQQYLSSSATSGHPPANHMHNGGITRVSHAQQQSSQAQSAVSVSPVAAATPIPSILSFNDSLPPYDHHPLKDPPARAATPFPGCLPDTDSGYGDDDCMRPINWGSVLSLSSQSALDPLNNNDLFTPTTCNSSSNSNSSASSSSSYSSPSLFSAAAAAFTSAASSLSSNTMPSFVTVTSTVTPATNWEYNLLDMDLGLGAELTELLPSWKLTPLSAEDILKSVPPPMEPSRILMDSDMDQLTHIMVGS